ncbi:DUF2147 domain-containing protein [Nitrobacter sp. TKz-YC01]
MKALGVAAALLLTLSTAQAGENFSFDIGGRTVRIHAPRGCDSPSCISISIPGVYNSKRKRFDDADSDDPQADAAETPPSSPSTPPPAPVQASAPASVPASADPVSAPAPVQQPSPSITASTPSASTAAPAQPVVAAPPVPSQDMKTVAAHAPAAAETVETSPRAIEPVGPLGMWVTEKKEGRVRIEACGKNLCGYSVDSRTGRNKEKILINMKPNGSKWSGKIYDPNSGSTYSSTVAMKGNDRLRVQGCAFGGMFCGGQTWTRLNQSL